jgi:Tol biopolymer transport system component
MVDYTSNNGLDKKNIMPYLSIFIYIFLVLSMGCSDTTESLPVIEHVYPEIDEFPSWSPDGTRIIYYHEGITEIDYDGSYKTNPDSGGLWMINADGSDPHILVKSMMPLHGEWSPDGEWIVVSIYAQIYKAKIDSTQLDTASVVQLTTEGYNFFPSMSPDGKWISYELCSYQKTNDIWKMRFDGTEKTWMCRGNMPIGLR